MQRLFPHPVECRILQTRTEQRRTFNHRLATGTRGIGAGPRVVQCRLLLLGTAEGRKPRHHRQYHNDGAPPWSSTRRPSPHRRHHWRARRFSEGVTKLGFEHYNNVYTFERSVAPKRGSGAGAATAKLGTERGEAKDRSNPNSCDYKERVPKYTTTTLRLQRARCPNTPPPPSEVPGQPQLMKPPSKTVFSFFFPRRNCLLSFGHTC